MNSTIEMNKFNFESEEVYIMIDDMYVFTYHHSDKLFAERFTKYLNFASNKKVCFIGDMNGCVNLDENTLSLIDKKRKMLKHFDVKNLYTTNTQKTVSKFRVQTSQFDKFGDFVELPIDGGFMNTPIDTEETFVVTSDGLFPIDAVGNNFSLFDHYLKFVRTDGLNIATLNVGNQWKLYYPDGKLMPYGEYLDPKEFGENLKKTTESLKLKHRSMAFPLEELKTNLPLEYHEVADQMFEGITTWQQMITKYPNDMGQAGQNSSPAQEGNYNRRSLVFALSELFEMLHEQRVEYIGNKSQYWTEYEFVKWYIWVTLQMKFFNDLTTIEDMRDKLQRKFDFLMKEEANVKPFNEIIGNILTQLKLNVLCLQEMDEKKFYQLKDFDDYEIVKSPPKDGVFSVIMKYKL